MVSDQDQLMVVFTKKLVMNQIKWEEIATKIVLLWWIRGKKDFFFFMSHHSPIFFDWLGERKN